MKKEYFEVVLEDIKGKFDAVLEYVQEIPEIKSDVKKLQKDMTQVKLDLDVVKAAVKDHSQDIAGLKSHTNYPV